MNSNLWFIILFYFILNIIPLKDAVSNVEFNKRALFTLNEIHGEPMKYIKKTESNVLKETKENLIRSFGLRRDMLTNNNSVKKRTPHKYILHLSKEYEKRYKNGIENLANTIRGCTDLGNGKKTFAGFPNLSYKFDISEIPKSETLILSEIKILLKPFTKLTQKPVAGIYRVTLYGVLPRQNNKRMSHMYPVMLEIQSRTLSISSLQKERWISFDISSFVPGVQGMKKRFIRFVLRAKQISGSSAIHPSLLGFKGSEASEEEKALLVLYTGDSNDEIKTNTRRKRGLYTSASAPSHQRRERKRKDKRRKRKRKNRNKKKMCRRKNMVVDFQLLGWGNWLISPTKYNAYYCHGHCRYPLATYLRPTNHATIQSIVHNMDRNFVPPACCVPTDFEVLPILSLDGKDRVVFKLKSGLVATNCGCR